MMGTGTGAFSMRTLLFVAIVLMAMPFTLSSVVLACEVAVLAIGALSCTLLIGGIGQLSFGQGLFFGLGAYATGIAMRDFGLGFLAATAVSVAAAGACGLLVGWLIVRRSGVYFVMLTLAFAQMGFFSVLALKGMTGGENGFSGVPRPSGLGSSASMGNLELYSVIAVAALIAFAFAQRVLASPIGSVLAAIKSNTRRCEALGYNSQRFKLMLYVLAGCIAGLGGAMQTLYLGFVPASSIDPEMSEKLLIISLIGGAGSPAAALVGSVFYTVLADVLAPIWSRWLVVIAALLIFIVLFMRDGIWGIPIQTRRLFGRGSA